MFKVSVSEKTSFTGNYGLLIGWQDYNNLYKNMVRATFMNENNEFFDAYVEKVNEMSSYFYQENRWNNVGHQQTEFEYIGEMENALIYFTDTDYSDDIVSFYTANYWNSNYTYNWLEAFEWTEDLSWNDQTFVFADAAIGTLYGKETFDYSNLAKYGQVYAVMDGELNEWFEYWDTWQQKYVAFQADIEMSDRTIDGYPVEDYKALEGYVFYKIDNSREFYGIEDLEDCVGFIFVSDAEVTVNFEQDGHKADQFQIYKANGFWHLRYYSEIGDNEIDPVVTWNGFVLYYDDADGIWYIALDDGTDPETNPSPAEMIPMKEIIKGFDDAAFSTAVTAVINDMKDEYNGKILRSAYTLLNVDKGVIFAYGRVVQGGARRWVAFDADTFANRNFGTGDYDNDQIINYDDYGTYKCQDELIYTIIGGTTYVKAMKLTDTSIDLLPYEWIEANNREVVIYAGPTGAVNTNGWQVEFLTLTPEGVQSEKLYSKIGFGAAGKGDILVITRDENGELTSIDVVGKFITPNYLHYLVGANATKVIIADGKIVNSSYVEGHDDKGNYLRYTYDENDTVVYFTLTVNAGTDVVVDLEYSNEYKDSFAGKDCEVYAAGDYVFVVRTIEK